MPFTDDDLKRLKEYTANAKFVSFTHDDVANLLARLEAAETCFSLMCRENLLSRLPDRKLLTEAFEAWRKAAGK